MSVGLYCRTVGPGLSSSALGLGQYTITVRSNVPQGRIGPSRACDHSASPLAPAAPCAALHPPSRYCTEPQRPVTGSHDGVRARASQTGNGTRSWHAPRRILAPHHHLASHIHQHGSAAPVQPRHSDGSHSAARTAVACTRVGAWSARHRQIARRLVCAALHPSGRICSDFVGVQLVSAWSAKPVPAASLSNSAPRADSRCIAAACPRITAASSRRGPRTAAQSVFGLGLQSTEESHDSTATATALRRA